jgi:hypothetical protein
VQSNVERLTVTEIGILLDALDEFALKNDPDRSKEEDDAIAQLASMLVGDGDAPAIGEILVLWAEDGEAGSNTATDPIEEEHGNILAMAGMDVMAVFEEDRDGPEVDDEADLDDEDGEELTLEA